MYKNLTKFPAIKISVFLDACFTGGSRNLGLVANRGVKIKPKDESLNGNIVVFLRAAAISLRYPIQTKNKGCLPISSSKKCRKRRVSLPIQSYQIFEGKGTDREFTY